ncbi:MAG: AzlD domain-containing protein [Rhodocyclales bacterium]|nr:AzlD domain-containing protein [Rhodocyclales bacterium]
MNLWFVLATAGLITFATRLSFIAMSGRYRPPSWFVAILPYVPIAALTALIAPDLLLVAGQLSLGLDNPRFWAGLVAIAVAVWRRNILLTIGCGFAVLWGMQWLV